MSNRLEHEQSPYLLQHKENPVDWYPWSDEAFEKARREDKPVFLSIGYSTCHWCHVMAHESFEDEDVAALMNEAFVSIKVDREERPDVDGVYMTACQMMTGQGGWPLTVFMTPEKKPFHVATYIPRQSRFGRPGMMELIPRIREAWKTRREEVLDAAENVVGSLQSAIPSAAGPDPTEDSLRRAFESLRERYDAEWGGFGSAPKFPSPQTLMFLLRYWKRTGTDEALDMVAQTLSCMRAGGLFDQLGYGFHRYSTDHRWLLPHFEKMLYDQALIAAVCVETWQATGSDAFRHIADDVFTYLLRDMQSTEGAFYSAEDADSEGREGAFYVWTTDEVRDVLSHEDARFAIRSFGLEEDGNFEEEATRRKTGENVLHLFEDLDDADRLERIRRTLLDARADRVRPGLDDKILADWNGLTIAALAKAGAAFDEPRYVREAQRAAALILDVMRDADGRLLHRYRDGEAAIDGMLDDYAYMIWGLIELYEASFDTEVLRTALELQSAQIEQFWDDDRSGFFVSAHDAETLIMRQKEFHDGAVPSGNAVSALNLLRLARLTGRTEFEERAAELMRAAAAGLDRMPSGFTGLLAALDFALGPTAEIVIAEGSDPADADALVRVAREGFQPRQVVLRNGRELDSALEELAPFAAAQTARNGEALAYVCREFQCDAPVSDPVDLRAALAYV